jgi:hypothetical protein
MILNPISEEYSYAAYQYSTSESGTYYSHGGTYPALADTMEIVPRPTSGEYGYTYDLDEVSSLTSGTTYVLIRSV